MKWTKTSRELFCFEGTLLINPAVFFTPINKNRLLFSKQDIILKLTIKVDKQLAKKVSKTVGYYFDHIQVLYSGRFLATKVSSLIL